MTSHAILIAELHQTRQVLQELVEATERRDNYVDMGVSRNDPVMVAARDLLASAPSTEEPT